MKEKILCDNIRGFGDSVLLIDDLLGIRVFGSMMIGLIFDAINYLLVTSTLKGGVWAL